MDFEHLPDDIKKEFYVKPDGSVRCKSAAGMSRLFEVSLSVFTDYRAPRLMWKISTANPTANSLPKSLKPLAGRDFRLPQNEFDEIAIACFAAYFADDSEVPVENAIKLLIAFSASGIRAYFQDLLGFIDSKKASETAALEAANKIIEKYEKMFSLLPSGIAFYVKALASEIQKCLPAQKLIITIRQWLELSDIYEVDSSYLKGLGRDVAAFYVMAHGKEPMLSHEMPYSERLKLNIPCNTRVYTLPDDEPILLLAFQQYKPRTKS